METEKLHQRVSLALRPRLKTALRERLTKGKDTAPQALPEEVAQQSQEKDEAVATQFHLFPYLPTELRLQIWSQATRYKRYVILDPPCNSFAATAKFKWRYRRYRDAWYRAGMPRGDSMLERNRKPAWTSRTPPPPLLSVSREAREVALKTWQLAFDCGYHPAAVYINFDQDDVVLGADALMNNLVKVANPTVPRWMRPHKRFVSRNMFRQWNFTPDVQNIQRVVACGNFMRGIPRPPPIKRILGGLESLTILRISEVKLDLDTLYIDKTYKTTRRSRTGVPLLSLGGIDLVKTTGNLKLLSWPLVELEVLDFAGARPSADFLSCWTVGPEGRGWESMGDDYLPMQVHLGPGDHRVRRSKWQLRASGFDTIWYAI